MKIGETIKKRRDLLGWTTYRLAKESGLSTCGITNIIDGKTSPSIGTLETLCEAMKCSVSKLVKEAEQAK